MRAGGPNIQMTDDMFKRFCNLGDMQCVPITVNWLGISSRIVEEMMTDRFSNGVENSEILRMITQEQERITREEQWRVMAGQKREDMIINIEIHQTQEVMRILKLHTTHEAAYATLFESNYMKGNNGFATIFTFRYLQNGINKGHAAICALSQSGKPVIIDAQTYELYVGKDNIINNYFGSEEAIISVTLFRGGLKLYSKNPSEITNPRITTPGRTRNTIQQIAPERTPSLLPHNPVPNTSTQISWAQPDPFDQLIGRERPTNPIEAAAQSAADAASGPTTDFNDTGSTLDDDDFDFDGYTFDDDFDLAPNNVVGQQQFQQQFQQQQQQQQQPNYDPFAALLGDPTPNLWGGHKIIKIKYEAYKKD
jgi:hypothetical protein